MEPKDIQSLLAAISANSNPIRGTNYLFKTVQQVCASHYIFHIEFNVNIILVKETLQEEKSLFIFPRSSVDP